MRHFFTDHAREQAEARYGRAFTPVEINEIFEACLSGKVLCGRVGVDGTAVYRMTLEDGTVVCPVMARQRTFLVTFLPVESFSAGNRLKRGRELGILKQVFASAKYARRAYKRERFTIKDALESE